jgi:hypothetical protein
MQNYGNPFFINEFEKVMKDEKIIGLNMQFIKQYINSKGGSFGTNF